MLLHFCGQDVSLRSHQDERDYLARTPGLLHTIVATLGSFFLEVTPQKFLNTTSEMIMFD